MRSDFSDQFNDRDGIHHYFMKCDYFQKNCENWCADAFMPITFKTVFSYSFFILLIVLVLFNFMERFIGIFTDFFVVTTTDIQ